MKAFELLFRQTTLGCVLLIGVASSCWAEATPIKTAVDATFAPHAMAKLDGGVQGFNVDLGNEIAKRLGRPITIEPAEFSGLVPGLNSHRYDFLIAPVTVTPERAKTLLFSDGYLDTNYTFLEAKSTPPLTKLEDLKGKTIAVNKGSNYEGWARENKDKYGFRYDVYGGNADAVQAVLAGRANFNLAGSTVAAWAAKQNPQLQTSYTIKTGLVWAIAFRKDDTEGRAKVSSVLKCMKKDGAISALAVKWFGFKPDTTDAAIAITPGTGVPGTEGYDPTPVTLSCK
ncbi:transporter substrate-binding domain-containing protein [Paraburkholderia flagellata]|uniref:transporter substrate-binding domain-containing protein n=1 Tax=Paraburkholderia flagellata TaxID=2883241 RepID=UPI001F480F9C|nr:transporter substrate-binding domain-containing protein [Paraburkholderia flagellata]